MADAASPLRIVLYPDPFLNRKARAVTPEELRAGQAGGEELRVLAARMKAAMDEAEGVGLAAPQVGVGLRLFLYDPTPERNETRVLINPVLSAPAGTLEEEEGCLSIPEVRAKVKRAQEITVSGVDLDGRAVRFTAQDLPARICQHEYDHLDGILFIQKIGPAARFLLRNKLRALEDEYALLQRLRKKR